MAEDTETMAPEAVGRRSFLKTAGAATVGAAALALGACTTGDEDLDDALQADDLPELNWEIATSWSQSLDTLFGGAQEFAAAVTAMTGGKFTITARAGGELVPALEILQSVQAKSVQGGHTASYYYRGLAEVVAFGTALPFGLNSRQQNSWLWEGGGLDMLQDIYRERFGVIQFPAGNTGVQMGGWWNTELNSPADIQGLRVRIPGLGGAVMERLGATVQVLPGAEIFQALQTGAVDAAEWVGPYDDTVYDLQSVSSFYYFPGWWEPGPTLEVQFHVDDYDPLPEEYKAVIKAAAHQANDLMMARYDARNPAALRDNILNNPDVTVLPFPDSVMAAAEEAAFELYDEFAAADTDFASVFSQWTSFRDSIYAWHSTAEKGMLDFQALSAGS